MVLRVLKVSSNKVLRQHKISLSLSVNDKGTEKWLEDNFFALTTHNNCADRLSAPTDRVS